MKRYLKGLWIEEDGQDLIEYSLLITFIAIATLAIVGSGQGALQTIWTSGNSAISNAATSAAS